MTLEQATFIFNIRIHSDNGYNYNKGVLAPHKKEIDEAARLSGFTKWDSKNSVLSIEAIESETVKKYLFATYADFKRRYDLEPKELRKLALHGYVEEIGKRAISCSAFGYSNWKRLNIYIYSVESFFNLERIEAGVKVLFNRSLSKKRKES